MRGARVRILAPASVAVGTTVAVAFTRTRLGDYSEVRQGADNAGIAIRALLDGDLERFAHTQPVMGLTSLVLRLPLAALGGGDVLWTYRLGVLACLLAAAALAVVLDVRLAARGAGVGARAVIGALVLLNPLSFEALRTGHPEEILGAALVAGAALAAIDGRAVATGLLLGLAVGTKQWALLAVGPCLLALAGGRLRASAVALVVAAVAILPAALADLGRYREAGRGISDYHRVYPESAWWPVSPERALQVDFGKGETTTVNVRRLPLGLNRGITSAATLVIAALASFLLYRRRRADALALLVAALVLRVVLDPANLGYYGEPWLIALATWCVVRDGSPLVPLAAAAAAALSFKVLPGRSTDAVHCAVFLAWSLPLLLAAVAQAARPRGIRTAPAALGRRSWPAARGRRGWMW